jgi:hypothetical protein
VPSMFWFRFRFRELRAVSSACGRWTKDGRRCCFGSRGSASKISASRVTDGFSSPRSHPPLLGLARSSENVLDEASGLMGSPLPLWPWQKPTSEVFTSSSARKSFASPDDPLLTFRSPPEYDHSGAAGRRVSGSVRLPPLRFLPLRRLPDAGQPHTPGIPTPG